MGAPLNPDPTAAPVRVLLAEAIGAALLCALVLVVVPSACAAFNSPAPGRVLAAALVGLVSLLLGALSGADLNPLTSCARIGGDTLTADAFVSRTLAQLLGASIAGVVAGMIGTAPLAFPEVITPGLVGEAVAAAGIASAAFFILPRGSVTRGVPAAVVLFGVTALAGPTFLGNPAIAIGAAVASIGHGPIPMIGYVLGAQVLAMVVAAPFALAFDEPTSGA